MLKPITIVAFVASFAVLPCSPFCTAADAPAAPSLYSQWENGPSTDPAFFPLAVWLQDPGQAKRYHAAGINVYVALWDGPNEKQLVELTRAHMSLFCEMNDYAKTHMNDPRFAGTIVGWMHGDEPDNAQEVKDPATGKKGYGPPVPPATIISAYDAIRQADPTRPVMLNLGQGVANDHWNGRGSTGKLSDYLDYIKGGDVISFDVYPVAGFDEPVGNRNLWLVPNGVDRLKKWSDGKKIIWNCIECTHIGNADRIATPAQVKSEVWMSLIHGSNGLIYFVHQFAPKFDEHALLDEPEMLAAVTAINAQIHELAPILNSPSIADIATVTSSSDKVPISLMVKRQKAVTYLFAVAPRDGDTHATFKLKDAPASATVDVIGESRTIPLHAGEFADDFSSCAVHLYRIGP
jgi:hypothetical protein